jgi:outer membrane protein W
VLFANTTGELGFGLSGEYRFTRRLGFEIGALVTSPGFRARIEVDGGGRVQVQESLGTLMIPAALHFHLTPESRLDFYVGPVVAYLRYDDLEVRTQVFGFPVRSGFESDDEIGIGLDLGADVLFGPKRRWAVHAHLRYLDAQLRADGAEVDFNPLLTGLGLGYRF